MRRVTALDVGCPACGAHTGLRCQRLDGHGETEPHEQRRRRAAKEQQRLNPEHVVGQLELIPKRDVPRPPVVFICRRGRQRRAGA